MTDIGTALVQLAPTAEWTVRGTEIEWHSKDISQPSNDAINAKIDELKARFKRYNQDRYFIRRCYLAY